MTEMAGDVQDRLPHSLPHEASPNGKTHKKGHSSFAVSQASSIC